MGCGKRGFAAAYGTREESQGTLRPTLNLAGRTDAACTADQAFIATGDERTIGCGLADSDVAESERERTAVVATKSMDPEGRCLPSEKGLRTYNVSVRFRRLLIQAFDPT